MVKNTYKNFLISFFFSATVLSAQAKLDGQFYEYATYYMSNIDVQTGESNVPFFRFRIYSNSYPIYAKAWFRASVLSPSLGINSWSTLVAIETNAFQMKADVVLDNRNFTSNTTSLIDEGNPPNMVPVYIQVIESINLSEFESMISAVLTTGQLADGEYKFELNIYSGATQSDLSLSDSRSKTIFVESSSGINLESPGGELADTSFNMVYTTYPIFNWNKGYCRNCETYIRVAEFKVGYHSSTEEAMRDERMLPFNQSESWVKLDDVSTYQYPISDARPLSYGKIYLWQIKTSVPTTNGLEDQVSPIYAFKISNPSLASNSSSNNMMDEKLRQAMGDDQFNALFGPDSPLDGFSPTGKILLNNKTIDEATILGIFNQMAQNKVSINSVEIEK
ncbi:MAG: hypothetical protein HN927_08615 [Candidatus Marinimicrobia bacterium]|jgi:hypothetical protein|nr:hypothetical protein [Candidatus Neomarinimicrobiota bacterium]MBT3947254.1 hypothetical protein [Candidatus Neomarinimicrobiota bacterium]MBT4064031.1 hypothetical protein [Candidatus Neomarinimicrobiota bacterium]MBT4453135.1 hypothetical protein [Candidatus Neomarinimicrobiota bacterium]MBT4737441.1 hypothetical protein [Candidatus Neomarinimicrobiota bacterium]